jgi:hypothetical protein
MPVNKERQDELQELQEKRRLEDGDLTSRSEQPMTTGPSDEMGVCSLPSGETLMLTERECILMGGSWVLGVIEEVAEIPLEEISAAIEDTIHPIQSLIDQLNAGIEEEQAKIFKMQSDGDIEEYDPQRFLDWLLSFNLPEYIQSKIAELMAMLEPIREKIREIEEKLDEAENLKVDLPGWVKEKLIWLLELIGKILLAIAILKLLIAVFRTIMHLLQFLGYIQQGIMIPQPFAPTIGISTIAKMAVDYVKEKLDPLPDILKAAAENVKEECEELDDKIKDYLKPKFDKIMEELKAPPPILYGTKIQMKLPFDSDLSYNWERVENIGYEPPCGVISMTTGSLFDVLVKRSSPGQIGPDFAPEGTKGETLKRKPAYFGEGTIPIPSGGSLYLFTDDVVEIAGKASVNVLFFDGDSSEELAVPGTFMYTGFKNLEDNEKTTYVNEKRFGTTLEKIPGSLTEAIDSVT